MAYGGDVDRGPFLTTINWVFNAIALVTVGLRLASHYWRESQGWSKDDGFILLAMAANLARAIYVDVTISNGFGRHLETLLEENPIHAVKLLRLMVILQAIGLWTFTLPKLPVAALLVNIFGRSSRRLAVILYSAVGALVLLVFIMTITTFVQCTPVSANWTLKGKCWPKSVNVDLGYIAGSYSAFLDFAFALYPILQISKLQMERSKKIILAGSMSLGFLACIVTAYKLSTISSILDQADPTWATVPLEVWNSVEGTTLIMAASIPLTRPLMVFFFQGFKNLTYRITGSTGSSSRTAKSSKNTNGSRSNHRRLPSNIPPNSTDDILLNDAHAFHGGMDDVESRPGNFSRNTSGIYKTVDYVVDTKSLK